MTCDSPRGPITRFALLVVAVSALAAACGGHHAPKAAAPSSTNSTTSTTKAPKPPAHPALCPLTGLPAPGGVVPQRPALAIKVENLPEARPQYGLDAADVIYEEPVEGGITRFIVIYQCNEAGRVEPVRSGRFIDPQIVMQYGEHPLFAYSGAVDPVIAEIQSSSLIDVGAARAPASDYARDPDRESPHNLMTSTALLWQFGATLKANNPPPKPVFPFGKLANGAVPAASVSVPWQYEDSQVSWVWHPNSKLYYRNYVGVGPALLANGAPITATNIILMHAVAFPSPFVEDVNGDHETELTLTGSGPCEVVTDGVAFTCTWKRPKLSDVTQYIGTDGKPLNLTPGVTWVELVPTYIPYSVAP